jgi:molybdate transport system substrate-binding protein
MKRRQFITPFLAGLCTSLLFAACSRPTDNSPDSSIANSADPVTLTVSAAASLQDALEAITPLFNKAHPNIAVDYNFGASGGLQQQIEQGAPADVFFSAATKQMDALSEKELIIPDSRKNIVTNTLVLIAPATSQLKITDLNQLKDTDISRFAVGEFRSVPAGQYAEQSLKTLDLLEPLESKFVFGNNVRSVLSAVESGNAELGMVYASDAALSDQVKVLTVIPPTAYAAIVYPVALLKSSPHPEAAQVFIDFLTTEPAQTIFEDFGFGRS